jgi:hypothetical protein
MHIAASRLERVLHCGGSFEMEDASPAPTLTQDQLDGDAAHEAAHRILTGQVGQASDLVGQKMSNGVFVTQDMIDYVEDYVTFVHGWTGFEARFDAVVQYEQTSKILCVIDAYNVGADVIDIADLKYGWRPVEVYPNFQMISYAIALRQIFPHVGAFRLVIAQPRPFHPDGKIRVREMTAAEVDDYALRIAQVIEARDPKTLKTGNHCRYCRYYGDCPAVNAAAFSAVDMAVRTDTAERSPEALSRCVTDLRRAKQLIEETLNVVEEQAINAISDGTYVPGYGVSPSLGNYTWTKGLDAETIHAATGIDPRSDKLITPAQLKKKGANADVVKAMTHRPNLGFKLTKQNATTAFKTAKKG